MITDIKNIIKSFKDGEMIILVDDDAPFHVNRCACGVIKPQAKRNLRIEAEYIGHQIIFCDFICLRCVYAVAFRQF